MKIEHLKGDHTERSFPRKIVEIYETEVLTAQTTQVDALSRKFDTMGVRGTQSPFRTFDICNGNHFVIGAL